MYKKSNHIKKILVIGFSYQVGGVETSYMNYYRKIDKNKFQINFLSTFNKLAFEDEIKHNNGKIIKITDFRTNPINYYKELKQTIQSINYDVVHINMLSAANILPIIACKKNNVPKIIVHSHNAGIPKGILRKILHIINRHYIYKNANCLLACSQLAGQWLFKKHPFIVINNAIDLSKYKYNKSMRSEIRTKLKINDEDILIGHVGRFFEQKNHEFLIKIFYELSKLNPHYKLILIGEGSLKEQIKQQVEALNLNNKVIFTGSINNTNEYYNAMDIFLLPSLFEGLPMVLIEAQTSGLDCYVSETVTHESKICPNFTFFPLTLSAYNIANIINNNKSNTNRIKNYNIMSQSKYNIDKEYVNLEEIYKN